jgi:hypothetical protein
VNILAVSRSEIDDVDGLDISINDIARAVRVCPTSIGKAATSVFSSTRPFEIIDDISQQPLTLQHLFSIIQQADN